MDKVVPHFESSAQLLNHHITFSSLAGKLAHYLISKSAN